MDEDQIFEQEKIETELCDPSDPYDMYSELEEIQRAYGELDDE